MTAEPGRPPGTLSTDGAMTLPNQAQVLSALRWILTTGGGYAIGRGWITTDQLTYILGAAVALVPLAWSFYVHTDANAVVIASEVVGVKVAVNPIMASESVKDVAADTKVPNVSTGTVVLTTASIANKQGVVR